MGRLKPFWPVRCRPTEGAGPLPERTAVAGGPLAAPLIGELSAQLTERLLLNRRTVHGILIGESGNSTSPARWATSPMRGGFTACGLGGFPKARLLGELSAQLAERLLLK